MFSGFLIIVTEPLPPYCHVLKSSAVLCTNLTGFRYLIFPTAFPFVCGPRWKCTITHLLGKSITQNSPKCLGGELVILEDNLVLKAML